MKAFIVSALLLIVGQAVASEQVISVQHDGVRGVTCWILNDKGISCLPDSSLLQAPASTTDENTAARASLANIEGEKEQLGTTSLLQAERFQL
ncbi:hypothetical protein ACTXNJ_18635 [Pseudomonas helleri]|uniref:hypothetical protein n=1 Tax=Pseudomonas helleri TaxID=1608996 RepID=UPI003FD4AB8C